jgi:uncharacterized protein
MLALLLGCLASTGAAHADVADEVPLNEVMVPPLSQRVTDLTSTLDAKQIQSLDSRLAAFEAKKGAQLAVLIVPTTKPETIEQYSIRVVDKWKLGRKGVDDGALLLIAKDDHKLRIEVGYGLEGALPDAIANRIIDEIIVPRFRGGDFYTGLESGLSAMMQVINGEPLPAPQRGSTATGTNNIETLIFIAFIAVVAVGGLLRALFGRFPAALLVGGGLGLLAWLTVAPLIIAVIAGVVAFVFVLLGGGRGFGGYGGYGGFGGGGFGGGGGGGGFSGGGGGFGGGGASGSW